MPDMKKNKMMLYLKDLEAGGLSRSGKQREEGEISGFPKNENANKKRVTLLIGFVVFAGLLVSVIVFFGTREQECLTGMRRLSLGFCAKVSPEQALQDLAEKDGDDGDFQELKKICKAARKKLKSDNKLASAVAREHAKCAWAALQHDWERAIKVAQWDLSLSEGQKCRLQPNRVELCIQTTICHFGNKGLTPGCPGSVSVVFNTNRQTKIMTQMFEFGAQFSCIQNCLQSVLKCNLWCCNPNSIKVHEFVHVV